MRNVSFWIGILLIVGLGALLTACGAGNGTVYVGVGVPGAWGPYPPGRYYPPPGYGGRPPCCWDEDEQEQDSQDLDFDLNLGWDRLPFTMDNPSLSPKQESEWPSRRW